MLGFRSLLARIQEECLEWALPNQVRLDCIASLETWEAVSSLLGTCQASGFTFFKDST